MNCYTTLAHLKTKLGITASTRDAELLTHLEAVSREVDAVAGRHFYVWNGSRYFDGPVNSSRLLFDDVLTLTALAADTEVDGTYDGESWTENTDFYLDPPNEYPKTSAYATGFGGYSFAWGQRRYKLTGTFGYGDGVSASPWLATSVTGTVASTTGTALTISVSAGLLAGQTILIGTEQMFVSSVTTTTATVRRGVNGTTAAIHSGAAISTAVYPPAVIRATAWYGVEAWRAFERAGLISETIGNYQWSSGVTGADVTERVKARLLGCVKKVSL